MYPIDVFSLWSTIVGVIVFGALGYWVADRDNSARPFGLTALPIALVSGWCWFTSLPEWTAWATASAAVVLFIIGMFSPEDKDDKWHYGAVVVAVFGKLIAFVAVQLWPVLTGQVEVPVWALLLLILFAMLTIASWRSERVRGWSQQLGNRLHKSPTPAPSSAT